jgi:FkbM family methyltransferase
MWILGLGFDMGRAQALEPVDGSDNALSTSAVRRTLYKPVQKLIHFVRRLKHPDVPVDHRVVDVSYRGRNFSIEVRRWCLSDFMSVAQCFRDLQYDMPGGVHGVYLDGVYREIVASGRKPLIVDCGANIGSSALWFSARYPEAHIVAIEPAPANFALLSVNCRGLDVELKQAGVGPLDGAGWVEDPDGQHGMECRTNEAGRGVAVPIVSLETLLASKPEREYAPFLLKVDIEGAEKSLFTGPSAVLDRFSIIIMEPHDWMFPGERTSVEFFRFHAEAGRDFAMSHENVASIAPGPQLSNIGGVVSQ